MQAAAVPAASLTRDVVQSSGSVAVVAALSLALLATRSAARWLCCPRPPTAACLRIDRAGSREAMVTAASRPDGHLGRLAVQWLQAIVPEGRITAGQGSQ